MFFTLVILCLRIQQTVYSKEGKAFKPGDVILGALNVLHNKDSNDNCGKLFAVGLGHTEAILFAIEQINNDSSILPTSPWATIYETTAKLSPLP